MWICDWCHTTGDGLDAQNEHAAWHINFLIAQRTEEAFDLLETPIPFTRMEA